MRSIFILIFTIFSFNVLSHEGATGIIKERMDNFKSSQKKLKQIKNSLNKPDFETIQNLSKELENWGSEMVNFFQMIQWLAFLTNHKLQMIFGITLIDLNN